MALSHIASYGTSGMPLSRVVLSLGAPDRHGSGENDGEWLLIYEFGFSEDPELPFPVPCLKSVRNPDLAEQIVQGLLPCGAERRDGTDPWS